MLHSMVFITLAGMLLAAPVAHATDVATDACVAHSTASLDALVRGDYTGVRKDFSPATARASGGDKLRQAWARIQASAGAYSKHAAPRREFMHDHPVVITPMTFIKTSLDLITACDGHDKITMFRFAPASMVDLMTQAVATQPVTAHVEADGVRVRAQAVASPLGPLQGALTLPAGKGPFPAVVLVAGSGPNDMDETIGPNKPFRDMADGLAKAGVASLRYDKRTFDYPKTWGDKGGHVIDSEVTVDAVAAAHLLAGIKDIDPHRVFVLGHSLGAMLAPRIGQRDPQLAGLVLMAAPARRIFDVLEQQAHDQMAKAGQSADAIAQAVQHDTKEQQRLAAVGPKQAAPKGDFDGAPQTYWLSWYRVDPVAEAKALSMPMLILQGGSDFQVSPARDFARWKQALSGRSDVTFHLYPGLSHLFMPAGKTGTVADYQAPGHVDAHVINDIARWIKTQSPARH